MVNASDVERARATDLVGAGDIHLRGNIWHPTGVPRAIVVIAHGKDEHLGRYSHLVEALLQQGHVVAGHDHRGYGKSDGAKGVLGRFDDYVDDLALLIDFARKDSPDLPIYLVGHSMGGLIAARFALQHQSTLAGLVLCSAALRVGDELPGWKKQVFLLLSRLRPSMNLPTIDPSVLSRDEQVGQAYFADPLCLAKPTSLGFAGALFRTAELTRPHAADLKIPLLIMHGEADTLTSPTGSQLFFDGAGSTDKTIKFWPSARHELFNELEKEATIQELVNWLNARLPAAGAAT
jgi:acylglycerol lipase